MRTTTKKCGEESGQELGHVPREEGGPFGIVANTMLEDDSRAAEISRTEILRGGFEDHSKQLKELSQGSGPCRNQFLEEFLDEWASKIHQNEVNSFLSQMGFPSLPSFSGVNPKYWINGIEVYFEVYPSMEIYQFSLVEDFLVGRAKEWVASWSFDGNYDDYWDEFADALCEDFENEEQLDDIESSVVEKLCDFEEENQVGSKEESGLGCEVNELVKQDFVVNAHGQAGDSVKQNFESNEQLANVDAEEEVGMFRSPCVGVAGSDIVVLDDKESQVVKNCYGVNYESNKKLGSEITTKSKAVHEEEYKHLCGTVHEESDDSVGNDNKSVIDNSVRNDDLIGIMISVYDRGKLAGRVLMTLLEEWRVSIIKESQSSNKPELILVLVGFYLQDMDLAAYPIDNITLPHSALYGPKGMANTDFVIRELMNRRVSPNKLVLGLLPYHGDAWTVVDPDENSIGVPASGPASTMDGSMEYKNAIFFVRSYGYGAAAVYNATYMVNLFSFSSNWINFAYTKEKKLLGYNVFQLSNNDNWILSRTAQGQDADHQNKRKLQVLIWVIVSGVLLFLGIGLCCYYQREGIRLKGIITFTRRRQSALANNDVLNLQAFGFSTIKATTDNFSSKNKLREGGFGPVYKGKLLNGKEIAVKRLPKTSHQRAEEFSNEITSTATPQHVNLVRVLGFRSEEGEKMLIYEYMSNKSLDYYLYDAHGRYVLDWEKRMHIIKGVTLGLLYLQEYSNYMIIHRDLKASNILLDEEMTPKILDFGMAKVFEKGEQEANTGHIVRTYGYATPGYVRKGAYLMKYDVYSFGVLLLQLISGKRTNCYYGPHENLNLLEYAYDLWRQGAGAEFVDRSLDDTWSSCKLVTCLKVALLRVQEKPKDRPTMLEVSNMLKIESATAQSPKRPTISISSGHSSTQLKEGLIGVTWDDWGHFSKVQLVKKLHSYRVAEMVFFSWLYKLFDDTQDRDSEKTGWEIAIDGPCNLEDKEVLKEGSLTRHLIEHLLSKIIGDRSSKAT